MFPNEGFRYEREREERKVAMIILLVMYAHLQSYCTLLLLSKLFVVLSTDICFIPSLCVSHDVSQEEEKRHLSYFNIRSESRFSCAPWTSSRSRSWHSISSVSHKKLKVMIVGWFWVIISSMIKNMLQIHALCQTEAEKKRKACKQEAGRPLNINPGDSSFHWLHSTEGKERRREKKYEGNTQKAKWSMKRGWEGLLAHLCLSTSKQTSFYSFSQRAKRDSRQRPWKYSLMYLHR